MSFVIDGMITNNFVNELRFTRRDDALDAVLELLRRNRIDVYSGRNGEQLHQGTAWRLDTPAIGATPLPSISNSQSEA